MPDTVDSIVINTDPLISLGRAGALPVIGQLPLQFSTPQQVADEITAGARAGYPVEIPDWVNVVSLSASLNPIAQQSPDAGEAAVIQLALEQG